MLPLQARTAHIIPVAIHSLLLVVTLCNVGCSIIFTKIGCTIIYRGCTIMCGQKCTWTGLWMILLTSHPAPNPMSKPTASYPTIAIAANMDATSSAAKYAQYIHQLLSSPPAATLLHALNKSKELTTILGLTPAIRAHFPRSTATNKGHMQHHRINTSLTRNNQSNIIAAHA
jgi:hypothetical protein